MEILDKGDKKEIRSLFGFTKEDTDKEVLMKFNIWCRHFFIKFFKSKDAPFHKEIDAHNLAVYRGHIKSFLDIGFRGCAKTTRTKLFVAFAIANDEEHSRKYLKVLSADATNSKQIVTDVYNLLINQQILYYYPEIFQKTVEKREETMASFTTSTGVKMRADTVGTDQRGDIQDETRPDFIWFDDFETRKTLRSAVVTNSIWDNMEEARNGLSKDGGALYNCNYLSERGNVHKLVTKLKEEETLITPIRKNGEPTWNAYTKAEVETIERNADDFAGEYMCEPSAGADIFFDRSSLERQKAKEPIRTIADFKMFYTYDHSHRYGSGHDVAGGVGLDSSTTVIWDFTTFPSRVVATFKSNTIKPDTFGDEIKNELDRYGAPICAVENNKFDMCIGRLKQIYDNLFFQEVKETRAGMPPKIRTYGWNTNADTKPKMLFALKKAVEDGHAELTDADLIAELKSYSRDDLMDKEEDVRLTTRHFDLLIACAIGYQMKDYAEVKKAKADEYQQPAYESPLISSYD
jgi:hypothetical protein